MKKGLILLGFLGVATLAQATTTGGEEKNEATTQVEAKEMRLSVAEIAELMGEEEEAIAIFFNEGSTSQTVQVFNAEDELVAEGTLDEFGQTTDVELTNVLRKSNRLMTLGDVHYYRLD